MQDRIKQPGRASRCAALAAVLAAALPLVGCGDDEPRAPIAVHDETLYLVDATEVARREPIAAEELTGYATQLAQELAKGNSVELFEGAEPGEVNGERLFTASGEQVVVVTRAFVTKAGPATVTMRLRDPYEPCITVEHQRVDGEQYKFRVAGGNLHEPLAPPAPM